MATAKKTIAQDYMVIDEEDREILIVSATSLEEAANRAKDDWDWDGDAMYFEGRSLRVFAVKSGAIFEAVMPNKLVLEDISL